MVVENIAKHARKIYVIAIIYIYHIHIISKFKSRCVHHPYDMFSCDSYQ